MLLANGDEPNLILPKVTRPLYFFSSAFWHFFASTFSTFSLRTITGLDGKIYTAVNTHFSQSNRELVVPNPC